MAILGNTTINGSLNINGVPVEPGAGTLKTDNSSPLSVTTESLGGTVNLHKISKTGKYTDLTGSAEAVVATTQHVHFTTTIDNNNFTLSEGGLYNIFLNEGVSGNVYNPSALGTRYLLLAQNDPAQNGLFERIGSSGIDYLFTRVTNQPVVIIREGHNKFKIYKMDGNGAWEGSSTSGSSEILQVTCPTAAATPAKEVVDASRVPVAGDIVVVTFTNGNSVSNPTLNINSSGAKNIRLGTTNASTTTMTVGAGSVVPLYFDGTYYNMFGSYRTSDANSYDRMYHNVAKQMGETLYRYKLILEGIDGKFYPIVTTNQTNATLVQKAPTNATLKIGGNILYYNTTATVAVDGTVSNTYSEISTANMVYSFNQNGGYQLQRPIYLVGIPQAGSGYKLDSNYYTQDLPTNEDGKIYIQLGWVYAENSLRLQVEHPIYEFKDGKVRLYIAEHTHTKSQITDFPTIPTIPDITVDNGSEESGKYISKIEVDGTNKHKLNITKKNLPPVKPTIELEVASLTTLTELEKLTITNLLSSLIVYNKIDESKFDDIILVSWNLRLRYSSIEYNAILSQITVIFEAESTKYKLNVDVNDYTYSTLTTIPTLPSIANQTEAEAGTDNAKMMTPLRVKQAIDKKLASDVTIGGNLVVSGRTEFDDDVCFNSIVENSYGEIPIFSSNVSKVVKLTQAQYDALPVKDGWTIYIIVG